MCYSKQIKKQDSPDASLREGNQVSAKMLAVPKSSPVAGLYVLATPIGNMMDVTLRAISLLSSCDLICCEDTRKTRGLLARYSVQCARQRMLRYDDQADEKLRSKICQRITEGQSIALLSDSGTPTIADPGFKLVRTCREQGLPVFPVPGPSALSAAISVCGLPSDRVLFLSFLPRKKTQKQRLLESVRECEATLVFFESPHRLKATLEMLEKCFAQRQVCLLREMTKIFETHHFDKIEKIVAELSEKKPRGEYTIVIAPLKKQKSEKNEQREETARNA